MKPIRFSAGLLAALILGFNSPAQAELPVTVTFGAALHTFDDGHNLDSEVLPVAAVEYRFDSNWAGQLAYSWGEAEADDSGEDVDIENWQLGIAYYFAPGESLHPYLGFGGGELSKEFSNSDKAQTQANVGAGFRYYLGDHWNWQADARLLHSFSDSDNDIALTVAIAYDFADPPAPVVPEAVPEADSDGDGVVDSLDECPDTPAGVQVDERGCPVPVIRIASIKLKVNFAFDSHVVEEHYFQNLEELADFLKRFADIQIELEGHTDSRGAEDYNLGLSERRAEAVRQVLVDEYGIAAGRLLPRGYGESRPVASNDTEEGRAENRRVVASLELEYEE